MRQDAAQVSLTDSFIKHPVLAIEPGAAARNSIGMVLVTGMTVGTIFTLLVVPVFYSLIAAQYQPSATLDAIEPEELTLAGARGL